MWYLVAFAFLFGILIGYWLKSVTCDFSFSRINYNWFKNGSIRNLVSLNDKIVLDSLTRQLNLGYSGDIQIKVYKY